MIQRMRPFGGWGMGRLSGPGIVSPLADAITRMEGWFTPGTVNASGNFPNGSVAYQNNNPGNIRFDPKTVYPSKFGAVPGAAGFARFPDVETGRAALEYQVQAQINKGQNLTQFFEQYAPPNENNTKNYINTVAQQTGLDPSVQLKQYQNGSVDPGVYTPPSSPGSTDSTDYTNTPDTSPDSTPATPSDTPAFEDIDPTYIVIGGVVAAGVLYVMFGR